MIKGGLVPDSATDYTVSSVQSVAEISGWLVDENARGVAAPSTGNDCDLDAAGAG